jgi:hypothetical protein
VTSVEEAKTALATFCINSNNLNMSVNNHTLMGTLGGTLLSIAPSIPSADLLKTAVLAAVGAAVSFTMSLILKCLIKKYKK